MTKLQDAKIGLRRELKNWLNAIEDISKREWNKRISHSVDEFIHQFSQEKITNHQMPLVGGYFPMTDEAGWLTELMNYPMLCFPHVDNDSHQLRFYQSSVKDLKKIHLFGKELFVPDASGKEVFPELIIVPGLSFSPEGKRLGRGGGFYDRYLESFNGAKVGICYEGQLRNSLPTEPHDQEVDVVVTETRVMRIKN